MTDKSNADAIKFDKVTKKFGDTVALDKTSFEIPKGSFTFIIGSSGAGKTTLIRLVLRELLPTTGSIILDGIDLQTLPSRKIPELRRKIGVVFQDFKLFHDRTVFENIALPLELVKLGEKEIKEKVAEILDLVGLSGRENFFPAQLAGGELQRVCLARAVVNEPAILFADEPTGNLDPTTSWQIVKLLKKINKRGTTVVMATHNVEIVNSIKERVIKLDGGKVVQDEAQGKYETK